MASNPPILAIHSLVVAMEAPSAKVLPSIPPSTLRRKNHSKPRQLLFPRPDFSPRYRGRSKSPRQSCGLQAVLQFHARIGSPPARRHQSTPALRFELLAQVAPAYLLFGSRRDAPRLQANGFFALETP